MTVGSEGSMTGKAIIRSIMMVMTSKGLTLISRGVGAFFVPLVLSLEGYGYFKTFMLYSAYVGIFHLGIIDGIVLKYGGVDYDDLERLKFRSYFSWYLLLQLFFSSLLITLGLFVLHDESRNVFMLLGINLTFLNIIAFFWQISQITQRFKELSLRNVVISASNMALIIILFLIWKQGFTIDYKLYIVAVILINILLAAWYINTYRDLVFGKALQLRQTFSDIRSLITNGISLLLANFCTTLILALDQQFVNLLFSTSVYAVYAFAYSILTLITVATSSISMVLYPVLKRSNPIELEQKYKVFITIILTFVCGGLIAFFPICALIHRFLPKYTDTIVILRIVFPGAAISAAVTVIMHNYYKVFGKTAAYLKKCVVILLFSGAANFFVYQVFGTPSSLSIASIITMLLWYLYVEQYFVVKHNYSRWKNISYLLITISVFYLSSMMQSILLGFLVYCGLFTGLTIFMHGKQLRISVRSFFGDREQM